MFSKIDMAISLAKQNKCSEQEKREKYHGVTAKVKNGKLVLRVICTTSQNGRLFIREVEVKVAQNRQKELPCQSQVRAHGGHHDKWVCTLFHKHMDGFLSLREQVTNMEKFQTYVNGVPIGEVRQELLGTSQTANYITDTTQSSQSTTSSNVLLQKRTSITTVAANDSDAATRMTSIDKKMSTSTEPFLTTEDPKKDNSSRVEDISTSTPYHQASSTQSSAGLSTTGSGYITNNTVSTTSVVSSNNSSQYSAGLIASLVAGGAGLLVLLVFAAVCLYRYCFTRNTIDSSNVTSYRRPNKKEGNSGDDVLRRLTTGDQDVPTRIGNVDTSLVNGKTGQSVSGRFSQ